MDTKTCYICREPLPRSEFAPDRHRKDGLHGCCRPCDRKRSADYYARNREKRAEYFRTRSKTALERYHAQRNAALAIYGGQCAVCDSTENLEIDHVDGGGEEHRKVESAQALHRRIIRNGAPLDDVRLQLLCKPHHTEKSWQNRNRDEFGRWS